MNFYWKNLELQQKILILGVGNILLSDDGVGVRLMERLRELETDFSDVIYLDGGTLGISLATQFTTADAILILDAGEFGAAPGTVKVLLEDSMDRFCAKWDRSVHGSGLGALLAVCRLTGRIPIRRALIVVQVQTINWGLNLSDPVTKAIPLAITQAQALLEQWRKN